MQLHEAQTITEVYTSQEVNKALREGWKLLAVTPVSSPHNPNCITTCYVLGKKKPAEPIRP